MEDKIKKFDELFESEKDLFIDEEIEIKMSEFEFIDEGILMDLKKNGFWKGLKRMGTKVGSRITNYIKNDKKLQAALSGAVKAGGAGVMDDIGKIFTEFDSKLQDAEQKIKDAEAKAAAAEKK